MTDQASTTMNETVARDMELSPASPRGVVEQTATAAHRTHPARLPPDVERFLAFVAAPLASDTLADVQTFSDSLAGLAPSSRTRTLAAVKSLLAFAHRTGYLPLNVGAAVKLPQHKDTLAERI